MGRQGHRELVDSILELLGWLGIAASETDAARVWNKRGEVRRSRCRAGWPDISLVLPPLGQAAFIEVKVGRDKLSPEQVLVHGQLVASGARVATAYSIEEAARHVMSWLPDGRIRTKLSSWFPNPKETL